MEHLYLLSLSAWYRDWILASLKLSWGGVTPRSGWPAPLIQPPGHVITSTKWQVESTSHRWRSAA